LKRNLHIFFELVKVRITVFVTVTTGFGYIASSGIIDINIVPVLIGVLLLAFGSAAMNHYQEKNYDAKMDRTKSRPIPSGRITSSNVLILSVALILFGSFILILWTNVLTLGLGLLNLFWYNFVYTLLKRITPFAIIPGSLVGAVPPMIGWAAAGGSLFDPQIIVIAFFFFVWQIPHFWLLLLVLDKDYQQGGFPTLTQVFSREQLSRITFIWISSTAVAGLLIPLFGLVKDFWIAAALIFCSMWLTWKAFSLLDDSENYSVFRYNFRYINYFALSVIVLVSFDKLFL